MQVNTRTTMMVGASWIRVGAMGAMGARGASGAGCTFRTDCTFRTSRTNHLPSSFAESPIVLLHHLLELVGHFLRPRDHDGLIARLDLVTKTELETLQALGGECLQALQLLRVLVDALVLELAKRRENLLELLRIDVEAAQHAAQVLRFVGPLPRLVAELTNVFIP